MCILGNLLRNGDEGVSTDAAGAKEFNEKGAEEGDVYSMNEVGFLFRTMTMGFERMWRMRMNCLNKL